VREGGIKKEGRNIERKQERKYERKQEKEEENKYTRIAVLQKISSYKGLYMIPKQ
jgi:hypothetical protein